MSTAIPVDVQTSLELPLAPWSDSMVLAPGSVRDAIVSFLSSVDGREASIGEIKAAVARKLGDVPASSIRSYLNLNVSDIFERTGRGRYRLKKKVR
jgi:hypothetical protein